VMTLIVVWLLKIPGLLLVGGALLLWIAYRLLLPEDDGGEAHGPVATTFWGAMRTIIVADAVMGLDNVLAVAGASHGSYLLVVLGLLISVPIVVWGSALVLKLIERYPSVIYLGAGVLVWTAAKMMSSEPVLKPWFEASPWATFLLYLTVPLVLWLGFAQNHRRSASRIQARLAELSRRRPLGTSSVDASVAEPPPQPAPLRVLVPVDGSRNALGAVQHAIAEYLRHHELELHLLNVQPRFSRHVARFVARDDRDRWHRERAELALAGARALLQESGVPHRVHWTLGDRAAEICGMAQSLAVHHIVMGAARRRSITRMLEDSVTDKVLQDTTLPVEVVTGDAVSNWERRGVPAMVIGAGSALILLEMG
jgi:YjbE family integral membrane protein